MEEEPVQEPIIEEEPVQEPVRMPSIQHIQKQNLQLKRYERNDLLLKTDKYMLNDFPLTVEKRNEVLAYRQYLRDYFDREDVRNWVFTFENQYPPDFEPAPDFLML
jgi:hypothetical protein